MRVSDRLLRLATTTQFMVARTAPPLVGAQLIRTLFEGGQDLALADVASSPARRLWESLGGVIAPTASLNWVRVLRPLPHLLSRVARRRRLGRVAGACAAPFEAAAGRLVPACARPRPPAIGRCEPMDDADVAACIATPLDARLLRGEHDAASLGWLLDMLRRKRSHGVLQARRIVDARGGLLGWYLYQASIGGGAHVVHVDARPRATGTVLDHLLRETWRQGCTAVTGRFDARLLGALAERHGLIYGGDTWVLMHARDPEVVAAVARDDSALTRLDGEWWMAF
jgi:hypothetical protein